MPRSNNTIFKNDGVIPNGVTPFPLFKRFSPHFSVSLFPLFQKAAVPLECAHGAQTKNSVVAIETATLKKSNFLGHIKYDAFILLENYLIVCNLLNNGFCCRDFFIRIKNNILNCQLLHCRNKILHKSKINSTILYWYSYFFVLYHIPAT